MFDIGVEQTEAGLHLGPVPKFFYPAYMKTYLDKDVRDLLQIKDMMQFHTFIRLCAGRIYW